MEVLIKEELLCHIQNFGEAGYPEEVAGFLLGKKESSAVSIQHFLAVVNDRETEARRRRYQITPTGWIESEAEAKRLALDIVGVFHTHPDHPSRPSQFDLEHALPNFIYIIAAVSQGRVTTMQAWNLQEDRTHFNECAIRLI